MRQDSERPVGKRFLLREGRLGDRFSGMARLVIGSGLILMISASRSTAGLGDGDLPDLGKPVEMTPIVSTPTKPGVPVTPGTRAVLALPGITTPASPKPTSLNPPIIARPIADDSSDGLKLDAPLEMKSSPTGLTPVPRVAPSARPGRSPRPLVLESSTEDPIPIDGPAPRIDPERKGSSTSGRIEPPVPQNPQRRSRLFGLFPGTAPPPPTSSPSTLRDTMPGKESQAGRSVVEGPMVDPSAESALKRRIEKQARESVGDRVRSIEVRVVGKSATIQARGVKLFQKRNVKKSLESIPALSGLRSTVDVLD